MLPVLIGTHPDRAAWLADCLASVEATTDREVIIHADGGYEIAALRTGCAWTDRFLFIHDSVTILDPAFWQVIDRHAHNAWLTGWPPMFMGIHSAATLKPILATFPEVMTKEQAIQAEAHLPSLLDYPTIWPEITDRTALRTEVRHGRENLILGNHLFEKAKGTWR